MSKLVLSDIGSLDRLSSINSNFTAIEAEFQNKVLYRDNPLGEPNALENDVDLNGYALLNVSTINGGDVTDLVAFGTAVDTAVASATSASASASAAAGSADSAAASYSALSQFTGAVVGGDLSFTGTGNRISGDFSNATFANRVMFQTSTVNGNTSVSAIPNGSSTQSAISAYNNSTPALGHRGDLIVNATDVRLQSTDAGAGTYLPMTFYVGGSERVRIDTSGNVGIGITPATVFHTYSTAAIANYSTVQHSANYNAGNKFVNSLGSWFNYVAGPTGNFEFYRGSGTGDVVVTSACGLGYGTGAGGTVTQATDKTTSVTLNKPTGKITTHTAAMLANTKVVFAVNNSLVTANDIACVSIGTIGSGLAYRASVTYTYAGGFYVMLENTTAGSLSEAVVINFAIIKGAIT